jgi:transporter family protein
MPSWLVFSIVALVFWGITGVTQKLSTNRISSERSFYWFCWAIAGLSAGVFLVRSPALHPSAVVALCAVGGGTLNALGAWTSFRALASGGKASIVISLISLFPLLTIVLAVALLGERLTAAQMAGAVAAIGAAVLLSLESPAQ